MTPSPPSDDDFTNHNASASLIANPARQDHEDIELSSQHSSSSSVAPDITRRLYISHFLSTWNSRVFEFGAVLYLATIFPGTLLPMSVYALVRGVSAVTLAPAVGKYIDRGDRLKVVRVSIVFQRLAVAISCAAFYVLCLDFSLVEAWKPFMLAFVTLLACVEKLCSIMNFVSVEKDWVVVVAADDQAALAMMNAQMRRIDLVCKLFGPLCIALLDGYSTKAAILFNLGMNVTSTVVEYYAIAQVYRQVPDLQEPKPPSQLPRPELASLEHTQTRLTCFWKGAVHLCTSTLADHTFYFHHAAFLPSLAGALLYLTVLSFAGQMVTYLLSTGYDSVQVGLARTMSVGFEVLATWVAPWLMGRIGPVRAGLWMSFWQAGMLGAGTMVFWQLDGSWPLGSASGLVVGTILSRLGLFGFDLCVQVIVQEEVEPENRGAFSSVEAAWQNGFELLSFASTIVFHRPSEFRWPALISMAALGSASMLYALFVRKKRGHLLHPELLRKLCTPGGWKMRDGDADGWIPMTTSH